MLTSLRSNSTSVISRRSDNRIRRAGAVTPCSKQDRQRANRSVLGIPLHEESRLSAQRRGGSAHRGLRLSMCEPVASAANLPSAALQRRSWSRESRPVTTQSGGRTRDRCRTAPWRTRGHHPGAGSFRLTRVQFHAPGPQLLFTDRQGAVLRTPASIGWRKHGRISAIQPKLDANCFRLRLRASHNAAILRLADETEGSNG
mgnify:FL=1